MAEPLAPSPVASLCAADPVVRGSAYARRQDHLDSLDGCEVVEGDLVIEPFAGIDLSPLRSLRVVEGTLAFNQIYQDIWEERAWYDVPPQRPLSLSSLAGLDGLERVGGLLLNRPLIRDLSPLANLRQIGPPADLHPTSGWLIIESCPELRTLKGLSGLEELYGLDTGARLPGFEGLEGVELRALVLNPGDAAAERVLRRLRRPWCDRQRLLAIRDELDLAVADSFDPSAPACPAPRAQELPVAETGRGTPASAPTAWRSW